MSLDHTKCQKAVKALQSYLEKSNTVEADNLNLLDDSRSVSSGYVHLVVTAKKYLADHKALKPKVVKLPHPIYQPSGEDGGRDAPSVCIFTKDPQRTYKDLLQDPQSTEGRLVSRVIGISKLKGKFKPYEARRQLADSYDIFLAEDSVVTALPKLLGKIFYKGPSAKYPISIGLADPKTKELSTMRSKSQISRILGSTWFTVSPSTMLTIRVGLPEHSPQQIAENIDAVIDYITSKAIIKSGWTGIRAVHIKTDASPSLPVYLAEKIYGEDDIEEAGNRADGGEETKRKRDPKMSKLEQALAEVVDEEELAEFVSRKKRTKSAK